MKKISIVLSLLLTLPCISFGKVVPVNTAKNVAYNYLHQKGANLAGPEEVKLTYTSGTPTAYFYAFSGSNCFVLVSAEDGVVPVLGYSLDRPFQGSNVPKTVVSFFEDYNKQIDYVINNHIAASPEIAADWDNLINDRQAGRAAKTTVVTPLLTTTWNQSPYYNDACPYDAGAAARCVTGCVATATAQVMKFWNWPDHGTGVHSYSTASYGTLTANYGATTYNWSAMPNSISSPNAAIATLMSHVGIGVDMDYSPTESGSYVISAGSPIANCAEYALKTYFDYQSTLHGEFRSSYSDATWISMLKSDLDASHPIVYAGSGTSGGHCFVFDGYDASSKFHVNWGWGGAGPDGYYTIDALNPPVLGTGGGGGGFNSDQTAILGIVPNGTGGGGGGTDDSLALYDFVTPSPSSIPYVNAFSVSTNIYNYSTSTAFSGDYGALAFDASGSFVGVIDSIMGTSLPAGYVYTSSIVFSTTGMASLVPGNYSIGIYYRRAGGSWIAVSDAFPYTNFAPFNVYNHNFIELWTAMAVTPNPLVETLGGSVTLKVYNNDVSAWNDSLYLGLYNLDGTWNSDIEAHPTVSLGAGSASGTLTFSTSSITATPGTYLLVLWFKYAGNWYLAGADYATNPVYINVVAPPLPPDIYEVNNTAGTAYNLSSTLTWVSDVASTSTPGSTIHINTDQDYYKVVLPPGYNYAITASVDDIVSPGSPYTVDAVWSYSTDGGGSWSSVYNNTMSGTISLTGLAGGTVIFHVSPHFAGNTGSYLFKISNIKRTNPSLSLPEVNLSAVKIYPNPVSDVVTIDLSGTNATANGAVLMDMQGRTVLSADGAGQTEFTVSVNSLAAGTYMLQVSTSAGLISRKITVSK